MTRMPATRLFAIASVLGALLLGPAVRGAEADAEAGTDRVWYAPPARDRSSEPWLPEPLRIANGTVTDFDGRQLRIESTDESVAFVPAERVVRVVVGWPAGPAAHGLAAYERGEYGRAIPLLLEAVQQSPPVWRQRLLVARLMSAAAAADRHAAALELVRQWSASKPPAVLYGFLPVAWTAAPLPEAAKRAGRDGLGDAAPEVRLVAASWLLAGPDSAVATAVLDSLAAEAEHPELARLADALRWRRTTPRQIPTLLPTWRTKIDRLPLPLQAGPLVGVGDRLRATGSADASLEFWLAAALLHAEAVPLATTARENAVEILEQLGRDEEAGRLDEAR